MNRVRHLILILIILHRVHYLAHTVFDGQCFSISFVLTTFFFAIIDGMLHKVGLFKAFIALNLFLGCLRCGAYRFSAASKFKSIYFRTCPGRVLRVWLQRVNVRLSKFLSSFSHLDCVYSYSFFMVVWGAS